MIILTFNLKWEHGNRVVTPKTITDSIVLPCYQCYMYICIYKDYYCLKFTYVLLYIGIVREFSGNMVTRKNKNIGRQHNNNLLNGNCVQNIKLPHTVST